MINQQNMKVKNGSTWHTICPFPVGFIYMSYTNTSPASTFGGQWSAITGRFLYANASVSTGGENSHTLSIAEMPNHSHVITVNTYYGTAGRNPPIWTKGNVNGVGGTTNATFWPSYNGNSHAHNNMPQYQSCYCWRRTS